MDSISLLGPTPHTRVAITQEDFDARYNFVRSRRKTPNCDILEKKLIKQNWQQYESIQDFLPFIKRIRRYELKRDGARDLFGSLLIAALIIPQALSVGVLIDDVSAALLSLFIPQLIYFIFGSARHSSLGSLSHTAFLLYCSRHYSNADYGTLTFYIGIIQIILFLFPSEWLFAVFPIQLFVGFSLGIFIRIVIHLLSFIFVFNNCFSFSGDMKLEPFLHCLSSLNVQIFILFLLTFFTSFLFRWKINDYLSQLLASTIPHELLLIIFFSIIGYFLHIDVSAKIPHLPHIISSIQVRPPSTPTFLLLVDATTIAIFSFCQHFRITRSIAIEKMHKVERKQEILTFSLISVISSIFGFLPPSSSPGNSQINVETAKYSLFCTLMSIPWIFLAIHFFGYYLSFIPKSVICGLIITSFSGITTEIRSLRNVLSSQPCDGFIRVASLASAVLFPNCNIGFIFALIVSLFTVIYRIQITPCEVMVKVADNFFIEENRYNDGDCLDTPLRILKINGPLLFLNIEDIRKEIYRQVVTVKGLIGIGIGSRTVSLRSTNGPTIIANRESIDKRSNTNLTNIVITQDVDMNQNAGGEQNIPRFIVLDCSGLSAIDTEAMQMLSQVYFDLSNDHIRLMFAGLSARLRDDLECSTFHNRVPLSAFYPTVTEAIIAARGIALPFHMSVSMNGYRDVIALSTAASNQDISVSHPSPEAI
ncbi:unnamed protein product [Auanema sp. JU1783]|nr:unnamed protein product [Auanema sp. JU1783]